MSTLGLALSKLERSLSKLGLSVPTLASSLSKLLTSSSKQTLSLSNGDHPDVGTPMFHNYFHDAGTPMNIRRDAEGGHESISWTWATCEPLSVQESILSCCLGPISALFGRI